MWIEFIYGRGTSVDYAEIASEYFYLSYKNFLLACLKVIAGERAVVLIAQPTLLLATDTGKASSSSASSASSGSLVSCITFGLRQIRPSTWCRIPSGLLFFSSVRYPLLMDCSLYSLCCWPCVFVRIGSSMGVSIHRWKLFGKDECSIK